MEKSFAREEIIKVIKTDQNFKNKLWLGTISELHKNKGLKYVIEAMHLLEVESDNPSTLPILIIIGEGEKRIKLQERINRYNLQNNVFLIGQIDGAAKYLKAFDVFTLTSITEALPYVILEAGQATLPVIASNVGGVSEIIQNMISGILVKPKEPEEIKSALNYITDNPEKINIMANKLKQKIEVDFSKEKMISTTIALYLNS